MMMRFGDLRKQDPTRINYVNESLRNLLTEAYSVRLYQVSGDD